MSTGPIVSTHEPLPSCSPRAHRLANVKAPTLALPRCDRGGNILSTGPIVSTHEPLPSCSPRAHRLANVKAPTLALPRCDRGGNILSTGPIVSTHEPLPSCSPRAPRVPCPLPCRSGRVRGGQLPFAESLALPQAGTRDAPTLAGPGLALASPGGTTFRQSGRGTPLPTSRYRRHTYSTSG